MLNKIENIQSEIILYTLEDLVPKDSLFRKIDKYIDFTFIYDEVKDLYCLNNQTVNKIFSTLSTVCKRNSSRNSAKSNRSGSTSLSNNAIQNAGGR